jgi:DnaJ-domain-containing protein 1
MDESAKFKEALDKYYKLKRDYEEEFSRLMFSIRGYEKLSLAEKRHRLEKRCVNCSFIGKYDKIAKKVQEGTIFKIEVKHSSDPLETHRILSATCGNPSKSQKCKLNIELDVGRFCLLPRIVEQLTEKAKMIATNNAIMDNKFNFGYMSKEEGLQALPILEKETEAVNRDLGDYKKQLEEIEVNEKVEDEIKTDKRLMTEFLEDFKRRMKLHYLTGDERKQNLKALMREFKTEYFDRRTKIMNLEHKNYEVRVNLSGDKALLRFTGTPIAELDFVYLRPTKILEEEREEKSPYVILDIERDAPSAQIRKRYYALARVFHPDKYVENEEYTIGEAADRFKEINKAYELLMDEKNRQYYDRTGTWPRPSGGGGKFMMKPDMLFEIFKNEEEDTSF